MWRIHRLRRLPSPARLYLLEAIISLVLARVALVFIPFRRLTVFFALKSKNETWGEERTTLRKGVQWAIDEASRFLPGDWVCFPRAIAAQAMLRRRGVTTTMYYGAATVPQGGLVAHVWLQDGEEGIVGSQTAQDYYVLARFPESL